MTRAKEIAMDELPRLCRERAAGYGDLRRSSLTAIALDRAADRIEELERQLAMERAEMRSLTNKVLGMPPLPE
jgi:hypothetical protein